MTALIDIQKALNAIRRITQQEAEAVRLEALALMAGVIADEAKDIEQRREPKPKAIQRKPITAVPQPKPAQKSVPTAQTTTPSTEPEVRDYSPKQPLKPVKPE